MSRWIIPGSLESRFREHESQQRFQRIEEVMRKRRRAAAANKEISVIVDHDRGDEEVARG